MSGYATIRRFYNLRDEQHVSNYGNGSYAVGKPTRRQNRKQEAAGALIALIKSASDSIRGGLFDPDVDAALQVDGLLALLGEALPFLNRRFSFLSFSLASFIPKEKRNFRTRCMFKTSFDFSAAFPSHIACD